MKAGTLRTVRPLREGGGAQVLPCAVAVVVQVAALPSLFPA